MGIIQRQATKQTLVSYAGTGIAALSTLFIYPLKEDLYGLWLLLFGLASFFIPFASLGINTVAVRFFPLFNDSETNHQGFLPFLLGVTIIPFGIFTVLFLAFFEPVLTGLSSIGMDTSILRTYLLPVLLLTLILLINLVLSAYISNFQRIVIPGIINNFWPKIALPILVFSGYMGYLNEEQYVWGLLIMQATGTLALLLYLAQLGELRLKPSFDILRSGKLRQMTEFALYGAIGSLGTIFAFRIDHIMISLLTNISSTGIYGIAQFIGNSIEMPTRSIYAIASPIIAKAWEEGDMKEIRMIYHKSSLNLLLLGLPLFGLILISIDDLFSLTEKYEVLSSAIWVVYLISMGKLIDMACSVNGQIIGYSKYFRFNLLAVLLLGILNVILNYHFIPEMGIVGAAWASFIAISAFNLIRSLFVWIVWRMQPFSWRTGAVLLVAATATGVAWLLPDTNNAILDILQNSFILLAIYLPIVLRLRLSNELNDLLAGFLGRFEGKRKR